MTSLPPPKQWALKKMTEYEVAEMLEKYIDFVDKGGLSVHCPTPFVRHYMNRDDGALPTVVAISTLPVVLAERIRLKMAEEIGLEDRLNEEVREILSQHAEEMRRTGVSYQEMYKKVKGELARQRKLILR